MAVLVDRSSQPTATELAPSQFLKRYPAGPYTTLVVRGRSELVAWKLHRQRLADSCQYFKGKHTAGLVQKSPQLSLQLDELILPKITSATACLAERDNRGADASVVVLLTERASERW